MFKLCCNQLNYLKKYIFYRNIITTSSGEYVHRIGIGTARFQLGVAENEESLHLALSNGINLIDTRYICIIFKLKEIFFK